jgi:two-component system invasion response regulator UvrY
MLNTLFLDVELSLTHINGYIHLVMAEKILVVDDQAVVRLGLEILLKDSFGSVILNFAPDFFSAVKYVSKEVWDLIILDINMPGGRSNKMIDKLRNIQPDVKVLVYTALEEDIYASHYMQAGANGFVSKTGDEKELIKAITKILFRPSFPSSIKEVSIAADVFSDLSVREQEVLFQVIEGKYTKDIASNLNLKVSTVSTYKSRLFKIFNVGNVIELLNKVQMYKDLN